MLPLLLSIFIAVGEPAPALQVDDATWQNTEKPLTIENLRGKVILLRWFTEKTCPYCKASAPALNAWNEKYADEGLQVIGIYHHKRAGKPQQNSSRTPPNSTASNSQSSSIKTGKRSTPGGSTLREKPASAVGPPSALSSAKMEKSATSIPGEVTKKANRLTPS